MSKTDYFIVETYLNHIQENSSFPSYADLSRYGITRDQVRYHFGNINNLKEYVRENHSEEISSSFASLEDAFDNSQEISKKTLVITTAVADSKAHEGFLAALDVYCRERDAQIIIMPCESVSNSFENKTATFAPVFSDPKYTFVRETTELNKNLTLASIQVSAKQIKPTTGLSRIGQREGSYIFAAPKQFLEYVPSGHTKGKNYAIMTPGACTLPSYYTNTFVSKRLSYIAQNDHTIGAIIVEIEDDVHFHFRQIQADADGSFYDLGKMYTSDGRIIEDCPTSIAIEIHVDQLNQTVMESFINFVVEENLKVDSVFIHDLFDGNSINHHITTIGEKSIRSKQKRDSLNNEIQRTGLFLRHVENYLNPKTIYVVRSNHDEFLDRYLMEGRYVSDAENHLLSLRLAYEKLVGNNPLEKGIEICLSKPSDKVVFLKRDDSVKVGNVEMAAHGDLGLNGARASLNSLEKIYGDCVVGHAHSPAIQRSVFRIGTFTDLDLGYNRGPSSWAHTACLIYENGQRQLVNYVNGKFCK